MHSSQLGDLLEKVGSKVKIIVNTKVLQFFGSQIRYDEVVKLANMTGYPSVIYRGPPHGDSQRRGIMDPGCDAVEIEDGMVFNVVHTGAA